GGPGGHRRLHRPAPDATAPGGGGGGRLSGGRLGRRGEELAARRLRRDGLRILATNWRSGRLEIDIVARDGDTVAFVEVKSRGPGPQAPLEALGRDQRRRLRRAAEAWIHE
ncbi:MAG: YraN family protein, partial [Gemmatimonadota bacterium]